MFTRTYLYGSSCSLTVSFPCLSLPLQTPISLSLLGVAEVVVRTTGETRGARGRIGNLCLVERAGGEEGVAIVHGSPHEIR